MWRNKKVVIGVVVAVVVLIATTAGVVLAQGDSSQSKGRVALLERVAAKLGIDQQKLVDAFTEAQQEMRDEYLKNMVAEGKITQEQADKLKERAAQIKQWRESRPDTGQLVLVESYKLLVRWARRQSDFFQTEERLTPDELEGKIVIGEFVDEQRLEYGEILRSARPGMEGNNG